MNSLGRALRIMRAWKQKTQLQVSVAAEITPAFYSKVEIGQTGVSVEVLCKIAKALDVKPEDILSLVSKLGAKTWKP